MFKPWNNNKRRNNSVYKPRYKKPKRLYWHKKWIMVAPVKPKYRKKFAIKLTQKRKQLRRKGKLLKSNAFYKFRNLKKSHRSWWRRIKKLMSRTKPLMKRIWARWQGKGMIKKIHAAYLPKKYRFKRNGTPIENPAYKRTRWLGRMQARQQTYYTRQQLLKLTRRRRQKKSPKYFAKSAKLQKNLNLPQFIKVKVRKLKRLRNRKRLKIGYKRFFLDTPREQEQIIKSLRLKKRQKSIHFWYLQYTKNGILRKRVRRPKLLKKWVKRTLKTKSPFAWKPWINKCYRLAHYKHLKKMEIHIWSWKRLNRINRKAAFHRAKFNWWIRFHAESGLKRKWPFQDPRRVIANRKLLGRGRKHQPRIREYLRKYYMPCSIKRRYFKHKHTFRAYLRKRIRRIPRLARAKKPRTDRPLSFINNKRQQASGRRYFLYDRFRNRYRKTLELIYEKAGKTPRTKYIINNITVEDIYFLNRERNGFLTRRLIAFSKDPSVLYNNIIYALALMLMPKGAKFKVRKHRRIRKLPRRRKGRFSVLRRRYWKRFSRKVNKVWWRFYNKTVKHRKKVRMSLWRWNKIRGARRRIRRRRHRRKLRRIRKWKKKPWRRKRAMQRRRFRANNRKLNIKLRRKMRKMNKLKLATRKVREFIELFVKVQQGFKDPAVLEELLKKRKVLKKTYVRGIMQRRKRKRRITSRRIKRTVINFAKRRPKLISHILRHRELVCITKSKRRRRKYKVNVNYYRYYTRVPENMVTLRAFEKRVSGKLRKKKFLRFITKRRWRKHTIHKSIKTNKLARRYFFLARWLSRRRLPVYRKRVRRWWMKQKPEKSYFPKGAQKYYAKRRELKQLEKRIFGHRRVNLLKWLHKRVWQRRFKRKYALLRSIKDRLRIKPIKLSLQRKRRLKHPIVLRKKIFGLKKYFPLKRNLRGLQKLVHRRVRRNRKGRKLRRQKFKAKSKRQPRKLKRKGRKLRRRKLKAIAKRQPRKLKWKGRVRKSVYYRNKRKLVRKISSIRKATKLQKRRRKNIRKGIKNSTKKKKLKIPHHLYLFNYAKKLLTTEAQLISKRDMLPLILKIKSIGFVHFKSHIIEQLEQRIFDRIGIAVEQKHIQMLIAKLRNVLILLPTVIHNHIFENMPKRTKKRYILVIGRNKNVYKRRSAHLLEQRLATSSTQLFKTEQFKACRFNFSSVAVNSELDFSPYKVRVRNDSAIISIFRYIRRPQYWKPRRRLSRRKRRWKRIKAKAARRRRWRVRRIVDSTTAKVRSLRKSRWKGWRIRYRTGTKFVKMWRKPIDSREVETISPKVLELRYKKLEEVRKHARAKMLRWKLYRVLSRWVPKWRFRWHGIRQTKRYQNLYLLHFQLAYFFKKQNIEVPYVKIIAPMISGHAIRRVKTRRKLFELRKMRRRTKYFDNTLKVIYLTGKFKNPRLVSEHFAREICLNKKHSQTINMLRRFFSMLKLYAGKPVGLINVRIFGKINWSERTRFRLLEFGEFTPTRRNFSAGLKYSFTPADARTGSFGIRVSLQSDNYLVRHLKHAVPHWAKFSLFPQRQLPGSKEMRLYKRKLRGLKAQTLIAAHQPADAKAHYWNTLKEKVNDKVWMATTKFEHKRGSYYEVQEYPEFRGLLRNIFGLSFSKWLEQYAKSQPKSMGLSGWDRTKMLFGFNPSHPEFATEGDWAQAAGFREILIMIGGALVVRWTILHFFSEPINKVSETVCEYIIKKTGPGSAWLLEKFFFITGLDLPPVIVKIRYEQKIAELTAELLRDHGFNADTGHFENGLTINSWNKCWTAVKQVHEWQRSCANGPVKIVDAEQRYNQLLQYKEQLQTAAELNQCPPILTPETAADVLQSIGNFLETTNLASAFNNADIWSASSELIPTTSSIDFTDFLCNSAKMLSLFIPVSSFQCLLLIAAVIMGIVTSLTRAPQRTSIKALLPSILIANNDPRKSSWAAIWEAISDKSYEIQTPFWRFLDDYVLPIFSKNLHASDIYQYTDGILYFFKLDFLMYGNLLENTTSQIIMLRYLVITIVVSYYFLTHTDQIEAKCAEITTAVLKKTGPGPARWIKSIYEFWGIDVPECVDNCVKCSDLSEHIFNTYGVDILTGLSTKAWIIDSWQLFFSAAKELIIYNFIPTWTHTLESIVDKNADYTTQLAQMKARAAELGIDFTNQTTYLTKYPHITSPEMAYNTGVAMRKFLESTNIEYAFSFDGNADIWSASSESIISQSWSATDILTFLESTNIQYAFGFEATDIWFSENIILIVLHATLSLLIAFLLLAIAYALNARRSASAETLKEYECGFNVFDSAPKLPFDVQFYIVGLLFLIFDLEVAVIFPWVMQYPLIPSIDFTTMNTFIAMLTAGFGYEWICGIIDWPNRNCSLCIIIY